MNQGRTAMGLGPRWGAVLLAIWPGALMAAPAEKTPAEIDSSIRAEAIPEPESGAGIRGEKIPRTPPIVDEILELRRRLGHSLPLGTEADIQEQLLKKSLVQESQVAESPVGGPRAPQQLSASGADDFWPELPAAQVPLSDSEVSRTPKPIPSPAYLEQSRITWTAIVRQLRETSSQLDQLANQLEFERRYVDADQLRQLAQRLRVEARERDLTPAIELHRAQPTSWEAPALRQPTPPPDEGDLATPLAPLAPGDDG